MSRIIVLILFVSVLSGCYGAETPASDADSPVVPEIVAGDRSSEKIAADSTVVPKAVPQVREGVLATYVRCAVYAGSTDYGFSDRDGRMITVRASNFEEDKGNNPILPGRMLEPGEGLEGPPGANPEMVGKSFRLIYDEQKENVVEVILAGE